MKFSYNWIRELVEGLDCAPGPLERLITMKTAECEGIEIAGELLDRARAARVETVEPIAGTHLVVATVDAGPVRPQDRGLRRAQLPARHGDRLRSHRQEGHPRRGKRRHAGQRRGAGHQPRPFGHHRTGSRHRRADPRLRARQRHRDRQQVHHPSARPVGAPRNGARSGRHPRAQAEESGAARAAAGRAGRGQHPNRRSRPLPAV